MFVKAESCYHLPPGDPAQDSLEAAVRQLYAVKDEEDDRSN